MMLYLAGPMRGYALCNFPAFDYFAERLRNLGHDVWSPAEQDRSLGFDPKADDCLELWEYMLRDLPAVLRADAIALLPGWNYSEGATLEALVAHWCRKPLLAADTLRPVSAHPAIVAFETVFDVLRGGLQKHDPDAWRGEPVLNHRLKAARHAIQAQALHTDDQQDLADLATARMALTSVLVRHGLHRQGGENEDHMDNSICRAVMAKACVGQTHKRREPR
jgi:hypothetical protein